jgi:protein gp37
MGGKTGARYSGLTAMERSGPIWTGEMRIAQDLLGWPLLRRGPRRIAVNLMSELFHENLATDAVDLVHAVMQAAHWHRFLVLTKRTQRMREYYNDPGTPNRITEKLDLLSTLLLFPTRGGGVLRRVEQTMPRRRRNLWPLPNLWLGVSVEDQARMARVGDLLQTPAAMRWVCFEPLLDSVQPEAVPVSDGYVDAFRGAHFTIDGRGRILSFRSRVCPPLDWVVAGGEIGAGARPLQLAWVRGLRDQCIASGVPFFFRQWGEWAPAADDRAVPGTMIRVGKRSAGRVLDGRTWDEIPAERGSGNGT